MSELPGDYSPLPHGHPGQHPPPHPGQGFPQGVVQPYGQPLSGYHPGVPSPIYPGGAMQAAYLPPHAPPPREFYPCSAFPGADPAYAASLPWGQQPPIGAGHVPPYPASHHPSGQKHVGVENYDSDPSECYEQFEENVSSRQSTLPALASLNQALEDLNLEKCQLEKEKNDVQEENNKLVFQNNSLQTDLRAKEAQVHRLETTLATTQRALEERQQIEEPCDWVVYRDEVQITDKYLGEGGWGKVSLGTFRGCEVAVKKIHERILSPYNRQLFEREMNIASKCRHPCLLQFIGATNDDGIPLFITELLETSLRALLEQRPLADPEISVISLDVSLALNYLHNMKPSPILHRDVSSANVLLWRQGDQWRGKVSDYGTAKFVQQTMTRAPGAAIYSAPEAVSSNQTPKVDVYSFGVLLCEMCIREMPDPRKRHQQVLRVESHVLRNLVSECVVANPAKRPEMSEIIKEIKRFKG